MEYMLDFKSAVTLILSIDSILIKLLCRCELRRNEKRNKTKIKIFRIRVFFSTNLQI